MILDSKNYRKEFETASLEKILQERDRIVEFMQDYENHNLPVKYYEREPGPDAVYLSNIEYLKEICDLIKIKMHKKDSKPKIEPFLAIEEVLSKFDESRQKQFLEDLKLKDRELYFKFMEWRIGLEK